MGLISRGSSRTYRRNFVMLIPILDKVPEEYQSAFEEHNAEIFERMPKIYLTHFIAGGVISFFAYRFFKKKVNLQTFTAAFSGSVITSLAVEHKYYFNDVDKILTSHELPTLDDKITRKYANIYMFENEK